MRWMTTAVLLAVLALSGCDNGEPPTIAPTGIDGLVIPMPDLDAARFRADPDGNDWLRLDGERRTEAGVVMVRQGSDWLAEDRAGNVWWLARDGVFTAGVDGAEAGLLIPAHPRLGDGWWQADVPGVIEQRATVVEVESDVVRLQVVDQTGALSMLTYARVRVDSHDPDA